MSVTDPKFNPSGKAEITQCKEMFQALEGWVNANIQPGRRRSLALTHMETAAMYAVKALAVGDS